MGIRVLIADDEPPARERLARLVRSFEDVEVVAELASGPEVLEASRSLQPDLLLLDVRMPGLSGIDVADLLRELRPRPLIVFVSAYDQHALEAFEVEALDYLTKPVRPSRLAATMERVRERMAGAQEERGERAQKAAPREVERGAGLASQANPAQALLGVPIGEKTELIDLDELMYVVTTEGSLELHTRSRVYYTSWPLKRLEDRLSGDARFIKISRQSLIQLRYLRAIDPFFSGTSKLQMADGAQLEASRTATRRLKELLE